jgi:hypothetical protein
MPEFSTFQLQPARFGEALPLVRMVLAGLDQASWRAHCASVVGLGGGVLASAARGGPLHGIASWRPDHDLRLGQVLRVEMIAALEFSAANPVRASLCSALVRLCSERDAAGLLLNLALHREDLPSSLAQSWQRAAFRPQAFFVRKPFPAARVTQASAGRTSGIAAVAATD